MGVPPGNRRVLVSVPERYVAGADTRGRREGRPNQWSQLEIHGMSGLSELLFGLPITPFFSRTSLRLQPQGRRADGPLQPKQ